MAATLTNDLPLVIVWSENCVTMILWTSIKHALEDLRLFGILMILRI